MAYVLDGIVVLIFLLCVVIGWRRGFIKTAGGLVALASAAAVSVLLSATVAQLVYTKTVEPAVVAALEEQILDNAAPAAAQIDAALERMPTAITALLSAQGLDSGEAVLSRLNLAQVGVSAAQSITRQVIAPLLLPVLEGLCAVLLFLLTYLVVSLLLRLLDVVARGALLKRVNKALGLLAGVVSGVLWAVFAVGVITTLTYLCWVPALTPDVLEKSLLISHLRELLQMVKV